MNYLFGFLLEGSGTNLDGSTAFGMTCTIDGNICARKMKLSLQVCDTQIAAPTVDIVAFSTFIWKKKKKKLVKATVN